MMTGVFSGIIPIRIVVIRMTVLVNCFGHFNLWSQVVKGGCNYCSSILDCVDTTADLEAEIASEMDEVYGTEPWMPTIEEDMEMWAAARR